MKKMNFSKLTKLIQKNCLWTLLTLLTCVQVGNTQDCVLAVNEMTNLSLDQGCEALVTPEMVGTISQCPAGDIQVILVDSDHDTLPSDMVTQEYVNETLTVILKDNISVTSSWGYLLVEDKLAPTIECPDPALPIFCYEMDTYAPMAFDNCEVDRIITTNLQTINNPCGPNGFGDEVLRRVTRSYIAVDINGMVSAPCVIEFDVLRIPDFSIIESPDFFLDNDDTHLECDQPYERLNPDDPNDIRPAPTPFRHDGTGGTGSPLFDGVPIYPNADTLCNLVVDFEDQIIPTINCVTKIMRTWEIFEWSCSGEPRDTSFIQMIEISDKEGPTFICPSDLTVSTNAHDCEATVLLPGFEGLADNCSDNFTYHIAYGTGFLTTNGGLAQLEKGTTTVTYQAFDECGRPSEICEVDVTVKDMTPPVVICDLHTTVSLTNQGLAKVRAEVFDDGSYDECKFDRVLVRRMDTYCDGYELEDGDDPSTSFFDDLFFEDIHFCCEDLARNPIMVVLRAYDKEGNYNDCMVEVQVQDKIAPTITCPANMTVNCDFPFDMDNLGEFFGDPVVTGSCALVDPVETVVDNRNQCNIGQLRRTFRVTNDGGTDICTQIVTFEAIDLFNDGVADNEDDTDITWPLDDTFQGCQDPTDEAFHPDNTGYPIFNDTGCELVGANWEDEVFVFNNNQQGLDACFKIVRHWTVIDWCQFETNGNTTTYPEWTHTQVLKVNDSVDPVILTGCERQTVCTYDTQCQDGEIELIATAEDNCTQTLRWSYEIDIDYNGTFTRTPGAKYSNSALGNTADASGSYKVGNHAILWTFTDRCGNPASCIKEFTVMNCKTPTPYCLNGLATDLMPIDDDNDGTVDRGMIELWANDFDAGSSHPCGYEVFLSFEEVTELDAAGDPVIVRNMEFTCETRGEQDVDIYAVVVTPEGDILQDYCTTFVDIQDNNGACSGTITTATIAGNIMTSNNATLANVEVDLQGSEMPTTMSDSEGAYAFPSMDLGGAYVVNPAKNDDYKNGVNTLDLVFIQRHMLELELLDSPYKILAGDVNSDSQLKPSDLLALRKLILGISDVLPNTGSWKFIDGAYTFPDSEDPFAEELPQTYRIAQLNSDMNVDFVAVKMGDVNQDANLTGEETIEGRSAQTVAISVENATYQAGDIVRVPLTVNGNASLIGAQFTIDLDPSLEVVGVESDVISVDENSLGFNYANKGLVTFSWNDIEAIDMADVQMLTLVLAANNNGELAGNIALNSSVTSAEAYNEEFEKMNVDFTINGRTATEGQFLVHQNRPNPFSDVTTISFDLPQASEVQFTILDVTGKVILSNTQKYTAGAHNITVDGHNLSGSGIYYYQIKAGEYTASRKMVVIE